MEKICDITDVDEPEFGCEGRPEGVVYAHIKVMAVGIEYDVPLAENVLYRSRCDEGMSLVHRDGGYYLIKKDGSELAADSELTEAVLSALA